MNSPCKKLIEVALPVKEISLESVRDKSIRHGHISTLHLWWARRPLPVCRAVVFASLVPDPLDEHCPQVFVDAVNIVLGWDKTRDDIYKPYTEKDFPVVSPMDDNPRSRLLMFIGKFSGKYIAQEKTGKPTKPAEVLSEHSLIKWESRLDETIITRARTLIYVSHNASSGKTAAQLIQECSDLLKNIKETENAMCACIDRHKKSGEAQKLENDYNAALESFTSKMPLVFDPFAGGGAIPLEAARLGCRSYGNDINPVAHIIQKGSVEFPQKYGKPITYSKPEFIARYGEDLYKSMRDADINASTSSDGAITIANRLSFDVEFYAKKMLALAEAEIGHYYPADKDGKKPVAYYWVRTAHCANPSCGAEVPLLRDFYLCNKKDKQIYLRPVIRNKSIDFTLEKGPHKIKGWIKDAILICPVCENITSADILKKQFSDKKTSQKLIAIIEEGIQSKEYRLPNEIEFSVINKIKPIEDSLTEIMDNGNYRDLKIPKWGYRYWKDMFSPRQLLALHTLVQKLGIIKKELMAEDSEYAPCVSVVVA